MPKKNKRKAKKRNKQKPMVKKSEQAKNEARTARVNELTAFIQLLKEVAPYLGRLLVRMSY